MGASCFSHRFRLCAYLHHLRAGAVFWLDVNRRNRRKTISSPMCTNERFVELPVELRLQQLLATRTPWTNARECRTTISDAPAVYAITSPTRFGRLVGSSNILYVGSTQRLGGHSDRARLYSYRYPSNPRDRRINSVCSALAKDRKMIMLRWHHTDTLFEARRLEASLLHEIFDEH